MFTCMFTEVQEQGHSGMRQNQRLTVLYMRSRAGCVLSVHPSLHLLLGIQSTDDIQR